jgi:hypothetical protein
MKKIDYCFRSTLCPQNVGKDNMSLPSFQCAFFVGSILCQLCAMYDRPLRIDTARTKKRIKTKQKTKHMFLFFPPMKSNVRILCRCLESKNVVILHRRKKQRYFI